MADSDAVDFEQLAALERVMAERDSQPAPGWKAHAYVPGVPTGLCAACGLAEAAKWHLNALVEESSKRDGARPDTRREDTPHGAASDAGGSPASSSNIPVPPKPLASFVEAGAVDARLAQMQDELAQVRGMLHHVMVLVMVMGDRQKISKKEYDDAAALIAKAEKAGPA